MREGTLFMWVMLFADGLFSQLCQVPGFNEDYGHTYRDYIIKELQQSSISSEIKEVIHGIQEVDTIFKILKEYNIEYVLTLDMNKSSSD